MPIKWTRAHEAKVQEILSLLATEAAPFPDASRAARKARREQEFFSWCATYLPHYFTAKPCDFHRTAYAEADEKGMPATMCWSRGFAKSTIFTLARTLRKILEREWRFVIIGARSEETAAAHMDFIALELKHNPRIRADYGEEVAKVEGTETDWTALNTRVWARGIGQSPRGQRRRADRPDAFIGDDLEDDIIARNPDSLRKLWEWLFAAVWPALLGAGQEACFTILCTMYGRGCLAERAKAMAKETDDEGRPLAKYLEFPALDDRGESNWPARYSSANLHRTARQIGTRIFRREFQCKPDTEDSPFRPEWIRPFDASKVDRSKLRVAMYLDPSASAAENRDFKALVVLGREDKPDAMVLCLHAWIRHASPGEMLDELARCNEVFRPGARGCEANGFQALVWPLMRARGMNLAVRAITNTTNKQDRILSNQGEFERGLVYFDLREGDQRLLVDQFLDFGRTGVHDDGPDSWDGARRLLPGGNAPEISYRGAKRNSGLAAMVSIG